MREGGNSGKAQTESVGLVYTLPNETASLDKYTNTGKWLRWDCAETVEPMTVGSILKPLPAVALICLLHRQERSLEMIHQTTDMHL